jgi:curved DNA-binding protein CbpA
VKPDHYAALGVTKDADEKTIKRAYRRKAIKAHPDRGGTSEAMATLNAAWECLGNAQRRLTYDKTGHDGEGPSVEHAGQSALMEMFDIILNSGDDKNIVPRVLSALLAKKAELQQQMRMMENAKVGLTRARTKVRKKKGTGLHIYFVLIDKRLEQVQLAHTEATRHLEEFQHALDLLNDYESIPEAAFVSTIFGTGTATTTSGVWR